MMNPSAAEQPPPQLARPAAERPNARGVRGEPTRRAPEWRHRTTRFEIPEDEAIKACARDRNWSGNDLIREAVVQFLAREGYWTKDTPAPPTPTVAS